MLFGTILYESLQDNYLQALTIYELLATKKNSLVISERGQLLKGRLIFSFGLLDDARVHLERLSKSHASTMVKNEALYYLAKIGYAQSKFAQAEYALNQIRGKVSKATAFDVYYLATLLQSDSFFDSNTLMHQIKPYTEHPLYPYLLFNYGIAQYQNQEWEQAISSLQEAADYTAKHADQKALQDRARHAIAQIMIQQSDLKGAWKTLSNIRTDGLYSNRSLTTYTWTAIELKKHSKAVAALTLLNARPIANREAQEARVLLPHLYEMLGLKSKAHDSYLIAIEDLERGMQILNNVRHISHKNTMPREFISYLNAGLSESKPALAPFLVDLMVSKQFEKILGILSDLYRLNENLDYLNHYKEKEYAADFEIIHQQIEQSIHNIDALIKGSEEIFKSMVIAELDKHHERMTYYIAQARLAYARLNNESLFQSEVQSIRE